MCNYDNNCEIMAIISNGRLGLGHLKLFTLGICYICHAVQETVPITFKL